MRLQHRIAVFALLALLFSVAGLGQGLDTRSFGTPTRIPPDKTSNNVKQQGGQPVIDPDLDADPALFAPGTKAPHRVKEPDVPVYFVELTGVRWAKVTDSKGNFDVLFEGPSAPNLFGDPWTQRLEGVKYDYVGQGGLSIVFRTDTTYTIEIRSAFPSTTIEVCRGVSQDALDTAMRYLDLSLKGTESGVFKIGPEGIEPLRIRKGGSDTLSSVVEPTAFVTGPLARDQSPPRVSFNVSRQTDGWVIVAIDAKDAESGVKLLYFSLDGKYYHPYTGPLRVDPKKNPMVYAIVQDNVGNRTSYTHDLHGTQ
jgi:hypothetical protein